MLSQKNRKETKNLYCKVLRKPNMNNICATERKKKETKCQQNLELKISYSH